VLRGRLLPARALIEKQAEAARVKMMVEVNKGRDSLLATTAASLQH
jgi:hypothetical protein